MSDFLLDLRPASQRTRVEDARGMLQYYDDIHVTSHDWEGFRLVLASCDEERIWSPYTCPRTGTFVAVTGRVAFDRARWDAAGKLPGAGGLACKAIYQRYESQGLRGLEGLNGNFTVHLFEPVRNRLLLVTDRTGTCLPFGPADGRPGSVYSSHPDAVARALGEEQRWDRVSLAEFLLTGRVSYPHTFYAGVRALQFGSLVSFDLRGPGLPVVSQVVPNPLDFQIDSGASEERLADGLAEAFRRATERRSYPELGRAAVALSGGLDSRVILSSVHEDADVVAFCCSDGENAEGRAARAIALRAGVAFTPLIRGFDHYGAHAQEAVRISGGMGDIGSNHFLGFRDEILGLGTQSLVTGCYCDYLFKSLALDTSLRRISRREQLAPYRPETYLPHFASRTALADAVRERGETSIPEDLRRDGSDEARLEVAKRRTFPLLYEGDNVQRTTVQRALRWYPPAVDNDVIDMFLRIPLRYRLNKSIFTKMVLARCPESICRVPDTNTGARVGAPAAVVSLNRYRIALRRAIERRFGKLQSQESWPNWTYYLQHSAKIDALWQRPDEAARELLVEVLGDGCPSRIRECFAAHGGFRGSVLVLRLLTAKLWIAARLEGSGAADRPQPARLS